MVFLRLLVLSTPSRLKFKAEFKKTYTPHGSPLAICKPNPPMSYNLFTIIQDGSRQPFCYCTDNISFASHNTIAKVSKRILSRNTHSFSTERTSSHFYMEVNNEVNYWSYWQRFLTIFLFCYYLYRDDDTFAHSASTEVRNTSKELNYPLGSASAGKREYCSVPRITVFRIRDSITSHRLNDSIQKSIAMAISQNVTFRLTMTFMFISVLFHHHHCVQKYTS